MCADDDVSLLARVAHGDMDALGRLVGRHQGRVLQLAYRLLLRWDLAEDVVQEAFLKVHRHAGRFRPEAQFTTWLYRVVVNLCVDVQRQERRRRALQPGPTPLPEPGTDRLEVEEMVERVRDAISSLPARQRLVLVLHRYDGLSHRRIARITGFSRSAVESLLVRAYANLRQGLRDVADE